MGFNTLKKLVTNRGATNLVVHSDMLILGRQLTVYKGKLIKNFLFDGFVKNLAVPSFNLTTQSDKVVDLDVAPTGMGSVANEVFELYSNKGALRTKNPIHNYTFVPPSNRKSEFSDQKSFGYGSIFDYFCREKYFWCCFGASANNGFTILHHVEALAEVPYRENIKFKRKIKYHNSTENMEYHYFARKNDIYIQDFTQCVVDLIDNEIIEVKTVNRRNMYLGKIDEIVPFVYSKLKEDPYYLVKRV